MIIVNYFEITVAEINNMQMCMQMCIDSFRFDKAKQHFLKVMITFVESSINSVGLYKFNFFGTLFYLKKN